jgi:RNA recognition motif-containing protein
MHGDRRQGSRHARRDGRRGGWTGAAAARAAGEGERGAGGQRKRRGAAAEEEEQETARPDAAAQISPPAAAPLSPPAAPQPDWLGRNIYVTNLPPLYVFSNVMPSEPHVHNLFSQFGEIERMRVVRDRLTNCPVGVAMVLFREPQAAQRAVMAINTAGIGAVASMWLPKAVLTGAEDVPGQPMQLQIAAGEAAIPEEQQQQIAAPPAPPHA